MRARLIGVVCAVVAGTGVGAVSPASVLAEASIRIPVTILYAGVYDYHETASSDGAAVSYINQRIGWTWVASGSVPLSFEASPAYGVENLLGDVSVEGASSETGAYGPPQGCTYSAGSDGFAPIRVSLLDDHGEFEAGYGLGIPEAAASCGEEAGSTADVLDCDFNSCDAGICPAAPPAVSTDRTKTAVLTAFQPTTSHLDTGYVQLDVDRGKIVGASGARYSLPAITGKVVTSCQKLNSEVHESASISITSQVFVYIGDSGEAVSVDVPTQIPAKPLTDAIALDPDLPSNPSVSIPPDSPQPPEYPGLDELTPKVDSTATTSSGSDPIVGLITIRCPHQDKKCAGTLSVTAAGGAPGGVLGHRSYSVPGGKDGILNVQLARSAGTALNRKGRLSVRVTVNSDVIPGSHHATGRRTVLITKSPTISDIPSG